MDLRQRFDGSTSAAQILMGMDLHGKVALVTGATNGIGRYQNQIEHSNKAGEVTKVCNVGYITLERLKTILTNAASHILNLISKRNSKRKRQPFNQQLESY